MARNCFDPGCDTGYPNSFKRNKALGKKNPSLFSAHKVAELLGKWKRAIPIKVTVFMPNHKLCELHFDDKYILKETELNMSDGFVYIHQRERPVLKHGSFAKIAHYQVSSMSENTVKWLFLILSKVV